MCGRCEGEGGAGDDCGAPPRSAPTPTGGGCPGRELRRDRRADGEGGARGEGRGPGRRRLSMVVAGGGAGRGAQAAGMTPRELSEFDDLATALVLDPWLGFGTHKMGVRFKPPRAERNHLKDIVLEFVRTQAYDAAYEKLLNAERAIAKVKQHAKLKHHVSIASRLTHPIDHLITGTTIVRTQIFSFQNSQYYTSIFSLVVSETSKMSSSTSDCSFFQDTLDEHAERVKVHTKKPVVLTDS